MNRTALVVWVLVGALAGTASVMGQEVDNLTGPEQQAMSDTVQFSLENNKSNHSSDWVNPDTGNSGGVTPVRTFSGAQGQPCREFLSTIIIGGEQQQGYGTACRQPDGSWQIVTNESSATPVAPPPQTNNYVNNPPSVYYSYPPDFYYPYNIYLSFGYVSRGGYFLRGTYFMDGLDFRLRYPFHIRDRIYIAPHDSRRYERFRGWWKYRGRPEREEEYRGWIHRGYEHREDRREWRDRDRERHREKQREKKGRD